LTHEIYVPFKVALHKVLEIFKSEGMLNISQPLLEALGKLFTVLKDTVRGQISLILVQVEI